MTRRYDALVIGSGIAGLFSALRIAATDATVALVTKAELEESNTRYAQGGIAAAMFDDDNVELHIQDTISAGAGLCNSSAVRILCSEGPARIDDLLTLGVPFDRNGPELARGLEAAHSRQRVLHAGGDNTGSRVTRALADAVRGCDRITVLESTFLVELLREGQHVSGGRFLQSTTYDNGTLVDIHAQAVVLASGGAGQLYEHTTNPSIATGDGVAAAARVGAVLRDLEFFQFHPTALAHGSAFLVSEAVRGEGAVLRDARGNRFMIDLDKRAELAPRNVVAKAITQVMIEQDGAPVFLDATALGAEFLAGRFPSIDSVVRERGIDWSRQLVPVTPAAHYWMGGVMTDDWGRTSVPGLFACGEVACTGVHGANRLASNSLLEGLVFGDRIAKYLQDHKCLQNNKDNEHNGVSPDWPEVATDSLHMGSLAHDQVVASAGDPIDRSVLQRTMWEHGGLVRDDVGLRIAGKQFEAWNNAVSPSSDTRSGTGAELGNDAGWGISAVEDRNLATIGRLIIKAAALRTESRGAHARSDFVGTDSCWQHHIDICLEPSTTGYDKVAV